MNESNSLPTFKYHPDPIATGEVVPSKTACVVCGETRGYVYASAPFTRSKEDLYERICPWCIANGSAAARFDAAFCEYDYCYEEVVDPARVDELIHRTPGYVGWQGKQWRCHCKDFCAYLGRVGGAELEGLGPEVLQELESDILEGFFNTIEEALEDLNRDGDITGYLFRCLHCAKHRLYVDAS